MQDFIIEFFKMRDFYPRPADSISHYVRPKFLSESVSDYFGKIFKWHNSANFEATTSRFCMVIDLNETYMMMMMTTTMMMIMMMMMMMKLIITDLENVENVSNE